MFYSDFMIYLGFGFSKILRIPQMLQMLLRILYANAFVLDVVGIIIIVIVVVVVPLV